MRSISAALKQIIVIGRDLDYWKSQIKDTYNLDVIIKDVSDNSDIFWIVREVYDILQHMPASLVKDCGLRKLVLRNLGPNKPLYPNHGYYIGDQVALNIDIFIHPDQPEDFFDSNRHFLTRAQETLIHEIGHAFDKFHGKNHIDLSLQKDWLELSGWSKERKPGLKRLIIKDLGAPEVIGEYFYDPEIKNNFTRFYARRNPWDDWADSFAFYVGGLKNKVPDNKIKYFDRILNKYYK